MRRIWVPSFVLLVAVLITLSSSWLRRAPEVRAQEEADVSFRVERVFIADETSPEWPGRDDVYIAVVTFRLRMLTGGSVAVSLNPFWEFANLDEGESKDVPPEMGQVTFKNVHRSTLDSIAQGDFPEVLGAIVLPFEAQHSEEEVRAKIEETLPEIADELSKKLIDSQSVINLFDLDSDEGSGDGPGFPELSDYLDIDIWGPDFLTDWYVDQPMGIRLFAYLTVDEELAGELADKELTDPSGEIIFSALRDQRFEIGSNPIPFKAHDGEWHLTVSLEVNEDQVELPVLPSFEYESKYPLLLHHTLLPFVSPGGDPTGLPDPGPTIDLSVIQLNAQFLTPWNEGALPGHWPNTGGRATATGEALACYDIVAIDETVNDTRRAQILGAMQTKAPYCGRPKYLPGEVFFTSVEGPKLANDYPITDGSSALTAFLDNVGQPIADDELMIVSRFPVVETHQHIFACRYGVDGLAAKGMLHARLHIPGAAGSDYVDVFATHLQAGSKDVRHCQILELADFIYEHADVGNSVLLLGDFNIDGAPSQQEDEKSEYRFLADVLTSLRSGHVLRDVGQHLTAGTNHDNDPDKHRARRIDYLFMSGLNLRYDPADVRIIDFADLSGVMPTLSDHAAVAALLQLRLEPGPTEPMPDLTVADISITPEGARVTIENVGNGPLLPGNDYYTDLYLCPVSPPTVVNQVWEDVGNAGLVWGIDTRGLTLPPGGQLILTNHDIHFDTSLSEYPAVIPAGCRVYVQVDSANTDTSFGAVLEADEVKAASYNNIDSIVLVVPVSTATWATVPTNQISPVIDRGRTVSLPIR